MIKIGIIGCGNMGEAMLNGIISNNIASHKEISVSDADSAKLDRVKSVYNVNATFNNSMVADESDIIIIAVKPQDIDSVLGSISQYLSSKKLLASIVAGVTIKKISSVIGKNVPIVRIMPNMPALIKMGFSALSFSRKVDKKLKKFIWTIFASIGDVAEVREKDLDAITAISGSGPAYFFYLVEVLINSGIKLGLKKDIAKKAVLKTALGSIELLNKLGEDPSALKKRVTSKGGTTEAALDVFKKRGLGRIIQSGAKAARDRSEQLRGG